MPAESASFNPEMLTLARQASEFTQQELANLLSISQSKLSKFENGLLTPSADELLSCASALRYPIEFFLQPGHRYAPPIRFHRKKASVPQKVLDRIHAIVNIRAIQLKELWKSAQFTPDFTVPRIDPDSFDGVVEDVARAVRSAWRMPRGPVANITALLERAGIMVVPLDFSGADVDAIAQVIPDMQPVIFVNRDAPADRLRFTLAHELGHLVMHDIPNADMEKQANRFAAEFLLPADDIAPQLVRVSLTLLASLKRVWKVSMAALLETAKRLKSVTERQYVLLRSELSRRGYLKREPASLDIQRETPELLPALVQFHVEQLGYGLGELIKVLKDDPHRVAEVFFGNPKGTLRLVQ